MNWKAGDVCICEFKTQKIKDVDGARVTEVSDGMFSMGGYDLSDRCFPVTARGLCISDFFSQNYQSLHDSMPGQFNFPDFNRHAISEWCEAMKALEKNQPDVVEAICQRFHSWCRDLLHYVMTLKTIEIGGVRIMRQ